MDETHAAIRGLANLIDQNNLSFASWGVYLEKIRDERLHELASRLRSSLEYVEQTGQLKGIPKANYIGALRAWQESGEAEEIQSAGELLLKSAEMYLTKHQVVLS